MELARLIKLDADHINLRHIQSALCSSDIQLRRWRAGFPRWRF